MSTSSNLSMGLIFLVIAAMLGASQGETIVVGGSEQWRYGFNYTDWALKRSPFYVNDTLVFKYEPPSETTPPHNVYLLPNLWSYANCDFSGANLLADAAEGGGNGFEFTLTRPWRPQYFASSGGADAADCKDGLMKFFVVPLPRRRA
ncbi:Early nodulin-55-2 like [Actinidia chinensis var. chinensis]|uniref:Early nodulin-55-2 like n=1 Tax=Actinidia chinensis var. chinensis TaxID=1590841 RepID=A0A2R6RMY5_ACTCC|nr:Early nodulin-55-2 like [Actinidia chinensis var. chinensis]